MSDEERQHTVLNITGAMKGINGPKKDKIIQRQIMHFYKADQDFAKKIAEDLQFSFKP